MEDATSRTSSSKMLSIAQEHLEIFSKTLNIVESTERGLGRSTDELSVQRRNLMRSLASELMRLEKLEEVLNIQVDDDHQPTDSSSEGISDGAIDGNIVSGCSEPPRCTSELKLAPWASIPRRIESAHPAIYVLVGQPGSDNIKQPGRIGEETSTCDPVEVPQELPVGRCELPELIVMKSMRLVNYIDFNIHNGSLSWYEDSDQNVEFVILRPFKMLAFFNDEIRNHHIELEQVRKSIKSMTEDEYDEDWRSNPPIDAYIPGKKIDPLSQTVPELTGLIKDFRALIRFMDHYTMPAISRRPDEHVYFSDLWYTFPAGSLIYIKNKNVPQKIWKVIQRTGGRPLQQPPGSRRLQSSLKLSQFVIDCYYIDFDGNRYIPVFHRIIFDPFDGLEPVTNLPACPLQAAEIGGYIDPDAMVNRGRDFIECTRPTHRDYTGRNQLQKPNGEELISSDTILPDNASRYSEWIDSEVMVDMERALHEVPNWRPSASEYVAFQDESDLGPYEHVDNDRVWDRKTTDRLMDIETEKWQRWDRDHPPTEREDLLLLPGRVFAFVFRTRKWACIRLGKDQGGEGMLRKRRPRPTPWNDLELPDGHKNLVQSLIESHMDGNTSRKLHFDLVRAKGKGIIILLHGVPGVGKTSTAECAAEANNRPLLPITCGDLGTSPKEVETKLQEAFQLAQLWNCVLLLDEADVFLAQRSEDDIQRNALVSVFLRVLEYYEGILFLTSNRVGVFDEALKSRLHMALYYPPLEWKYTKRIWETHLKKLTASDLIELDDKDIIDYAETFFEDQSKPESTIGPVWNGRQIRNAFQSAVALAGYKHQGTHKILLTRDHFEKVSKVSNQFNDYLWSIQCKTDADKASTWGYRHDRWVKPGINGHTVDRRSRNMSIDGGTMSFALNTAAAGPSYQQQTISQVAPPIQGFPPQQQQQVQMLLQQQGPVLTQGVYQESHQHIQGQFGQRQEGLSQPLQHQFSQQHQYEQHHQQLQQQQYQQYQQQQPPPPPPPPQR